MLINVRRKIVQKEIKKYSELKIADWWNGDIVSCIRKYSYLGNQRYSKKRTNKSFEYPNIQTDLLIPYYQVGKTTYNLIPCPSGSFWKGSDRKGDANPFEKMQIEKPFLLGETEITQELYRAVMGNAKSESKGAKKPMESVTWYYAVKFCNELSAILGLDCYYTLSEDGKNIDASEAKEQDYDLYVIGTNPISKGFRLPTEWEWEYAAKAGTQLLYSGSDNPDEVAWYNANSGDKTHLVKEKKPNAWGFYDMTGNVQEWCENKTFPDKSYKNAARMTRGGSFDTRSNMDFFTTHRAGQTPNVDTRYTGFRVCRYI